MEGFIPLSLRSPVEPLLTLLEIKSAILLEAGAAIPRKHSKIYYFLDENINGWWSSEEE